MFFEGLFGYTHAPEEETSPFKSLYDAVVLGGQGAYIIAFTVLVFVLAIGAIIAALSLFFAVSGMERDQAKQMIRRVILIALFSTGVVGFVAMVFSAFAIH